MLIKVVTEPRANGSTVHVGLAMCNDTPFVLSATMQALSVLGYQLDRMSRSDWEYLASKHIAKYASGPRNKIPAITIGTCDGLPGPRDWSLGGHEVRIDGSALVVDGIRYGRDQVTVAKPRTGSFTGPKSDLPSPSRAVLRVDDLSIDLSGSDGDWLIREQRINEWLGSQDPQTD